MPPTHLAPTAMLLTSRNLTFSEREEVALECARGTGIRAIARKLGRSPSTVSREIRRNSATRGGDFDYRAITAQWHADRAAQRPKSSKLVGNPALRDYVQDRLSGLIATPDGIAFDGPVVVWKGRRAVHRQSRRWSCAWSPEQIAQRMKIDFPEDTTMRISHEAIYQALYIQGRGALKRELSACLRSGRALRLPRERARSRGRPFLVDALMISDRPAEIGDRAVPGHSLPGSAFAKQMSREGGGRPHSRPRQLSDWHASRTHNTLHHALAPAAYGRQWEGRCAEEWTRTGWPWCRGRPRRDCGDHHGTSCASSPIFDLGSGCGNGPTCATPNRYRAGNLFLRPTKPLAAREQRKYQRLAAPILSQGHRSQPARCQ
jgi:hypothetical protein